jgi:DNA-3-methyladenine glycosylase I
MIDEGLIRGEDGVVRCSWADSASEYRAYHDTEWGLPVAEDRRLFEKLCLEGFQSGLSWLTILRKRDAFRRAFAGFDFDRVARFGDRDIERLLADASIVRHRGKIEATVNNARRAVELVETEGSLAAYVWRFEPDPQTRPKLLTWEALSQLAQTPESQVTGEGPEAPRLALRRPDHGLCVHAGDGARKRPSPRLRRARAGRAGPCDLRSPELGPTRACSCPRPPPAAWRAAR